MGEVVVKMNFCDKIHKIKVTAREDGDFDLHVATNCNHIRDYVNNIGPILTLTDLCERSLSKVYDPRNCEPITPTCLTPAAIISAGWLEAGMLSSSRAKVVGENCVEFKVE